MMRTLFAKALALALLPLLIIGIFPAPTDAATVIPFTAAGTTSWTVPTGVTSVSVLVVAGGGGGGGGAFGGGGGGGGFVNKTNYAVTPGASITVTVGAGGAGGSGAGVRGSNGGNSVFGTITSIGGGGGGSYNTANSGLAGGSGGGGSLYTPATGGAGTAGQGHSGAPGGTYQGQSSSFGGGGGGGGAGAAGHEDIITSPGGGGDGGVGAVSIITGSAVTYAGGGGGGAWTGTTNPGAGGAGGGGAGGVHGASGYNGTAGTANTGGGGGGGGWSGSTAAGGAGGSGIVIVSYGAPSVTLSKNSTITGNASVLGAIAKGSGTFVIDHPLDPKNKLLYHSFVESPDAMNIYDGIVQLDGNGEATITLPDYFLALNKDFQYLATPVGAPMPNLHLSLAVRKRFILFGAPELAIAGGAPKGKVSWQVTGIRHDAFIQEHPIVPEVDKGPGQLVNKGQYLCPECYATGTKK